MDYMELQKISTDCRILMARNLLAVTVSSKRIPFIKDGQAL